MRYRWAGPTFSLHRCDSVKVKAMATTSLLSGTSTLTIPPLHTSFKRLNTSIYFHDGIKETTDFQNGYLDDSTPSRVPADKAPHLIILCAWMGATAKVIAKYTAVYMKLFPSTPIILIRTELFDIMALPPLFLWRRYSPALDILFRISHSNPSPRIVAQTFSNGGVFALSNFARFYHRLTGSPPPISALIFDSGPAIGNIERSVAAIMLQMPRHPLLWYPVLVWLNVLLRVLYWAGRAIGRKSVVRRMYLALNQKGLLPPSARRLYLYSLSDKLVDWREVEAHARTAEESGVAAEVTMVRFEKSAHVAHIREDPDKYWGAIVKLVLGNDEHRTRGRGSIVEGTSA